MEVDFQKVPDSIPSGGGGGKASKLKKFLKPPYVYFVIGGIGLGAYVLLRGGSSNAQAVSTGTAITTEDTTASNADLSDAFSSISDALTENSSNIDSLASGLVDYQNYNESALYDMTDRLNELQEELLKTNDSISTSKELDNDSEYSELDSQIAAAKDIKALQTNYASLYTSFKSDGKISEAEQTALDDLHIQAEVIGVNAGFGVGGLDGSERKIPSTVKSAVK